MVLRSFFSVLMTLLIGLDFPVARAFAQDPPAPKKLQLVIIEGDGAVNNIRQRVAREPIVEVRDENNKPLAGAAVVFTLPGNGASGVFPNGSRVLTVVTDDTGRAVGRGLQPNNAAGKMQIRVNASMRGQTASTTITQTNTIAGVAAGIATGKLIAIIAVVGGAAAAGAAVAVTRNGGGNGTPTGPTSTVINPGSPTVGPPR